MAKSGVLNVYIEDISPRTNWVFKLLFEELLGIPLDISNNLPENPGDEVAVLNYSSRKLPGIPSFTPAGLLSEQGISEQNIQMSEYNDLPVFYAVENGELPFDPFSMAFYLVSRYEEYLPFEADQHGRFPHSMSLAYREGFLDTALVNRLALILKDILINRYPRLKFKARDYSFTPSVDIDIAFAHLGKGFVRTYGAMLKLLLKGNIGEVQSRFKTMQGKADDPYDNFNWLSESFQKHGLEPLYFILAGDSGPYDRNLSLKNKGFADLVRCLSEKAEIGIHPSYASASEAVKIGREIQRLESVTAQKITKSRQHFVRMKFPDTYDALLQAGISDDYSMGYASIGGFRASIASPFRYYNIIKEEETKLLVHPFMFMDTSLDDYMGLKPGQYAKAVGKFIEEVKACKGNLMGIWHNYALANDEEKHLAFRKIIEMAAVK